MKLYSLLPTAAALALTMSTSGMSIATVSSGDVFRCPDFASVYYLGANGRRYVFPNDKTYFSWYADFKNVRTITCQELGAITIGGNVTYRPGVRMLKIESDPRVYAISAGGTLRPIGSETVAAALYGPNWNKQIDDLADAFFVNYAIGTTISSAADFNKAAETSTAATINTDKHLNPAY